MWRLDLKGRKFKTFQSVAEEEKETGYIYPD